jgi:peptide/histidine transporter 3/4
MDSMDEISSTTTSVYERVEDSEGEKNEKKSEKKSIKNICHIDGRQIKRSFLSQVLLFRNKRLLLVLTWNLLLSCFETIFLLILVSNDNETQSILIFPVGYALYFIAKLILYPLAGWLTDVYLGRYLVMKCSMIILWISCLIFLTDRIIHSIFPDHPADTVLEIIVFAVNTVGFAGFNVNVLLYGIDQLSDPSTEDIKSFIRWYYWTMNVLVCLVSFLAFSICTVTSRYEYALVFASIFVATTTSLALCSLYLFNNILIKTHKKTNPYSLIKNVLLYSAKHSYPQNRSALTYNESFQPKRIDYGKTLYGGPFTYDEVENVKTFIHMLKAMIAIGLFLMIYYLVANNTKIFVAHVNSTDHKFVHECVLYSDFYWFLNPFFITVCIPLYELALYPFLNKYIPRTLRQIGIAFILNILVLVLLLVLDEVGTKGEQNILSNVSFWWSLLPIFIGSVAEMLGRIASFEFVCAQAPESFKGFMIGMLYGVDGLFAILGSCLSIPFILTDQEDENNNYISYPHVFFIVPIALGIITLILYVAIASSYKNRQRDPVTNEYHLIETHIEHMINVRDQLAQYDDK